MVKVQYTECSHQQVNKENGMKVSSPSECDFVQELNISLINLFRQLSPPTMRLLNGLGVNPNTSSSFSFKSFRIGEFLKDLSKHFDSLGSSTSRVYVFIQENRKRSSMYKSSRKRYQIYSDILGFVNLTLLPFVLLILGDYIRHIKFY